MRRNTRHLYYSIDEACERAKKILGYAVPKAWMSRGLAANKRGPYRKPKYFDRHIVAHKTDKAPPKYMFIAKTFAMGLHRYVNDVPATKKKKKRTITEMGQDEFVNESE